MALGQQRSLCKWLRHINRVKYPEGEGKLFADRVSMGSYHRILSTVNNYLQVSPRLTDFKCSTDPKTNARLAGSFGGGKATPSMGSAHLL